MSPGNEISLIRPSFKFGERDRRELRCRELALVVLKELFVRIKQNANGVHRIFTTELMPGFLGCLEDLLGIKSLALGNLQDYILEGSFILRTFCRCLFCGFFHHLLCGFLDCFFRRRFSGFLLGGWTASTLDRRCSLSSRHAQRGINLSQTLYSAGNGRLRRSQSLLQRSPLTLQRGNCLLVAGRGDGEEKARLSLGQGFCLHLVNSFEEEGLLVVDVVELDRPVYDQYQVVPDLFTEVRRAQPVRYRVDLGRSEVVQRQGLDYLHMADFPSVDPRLAGGPCDDFWMLGIGHTEKEGRKFFDELVHLRWSAGGPAGLWRAPAGHYLGGEPVFVPNPDDAGGTVICQSFDAARRHSAFLLFDAFDIASGPVATLHLESPVHLGFHTSFVAA